MRLANRKKLVRIRRTIYEDPGNPFSVETEAGKTEDTDEVNCRPPTRFWTYGKALPAPNLRFDRRNESPVRSDLNASSRYGSDRAKSRPKTPMSSPATIRPPLSHHGPSKANKAHHRRSKSVAALTMPTAPDDSSEEEYVPPRDFWRQGSMPYVTTAKAMEQERDDGGGLRDTKWYGFYDDLMTTYERDSLAP